MKQLSILILTATLATAASSKVDIFTAKDLQGTSAELKQQGGGKFASKELSRYGNHYTMLAFRGETGSSELHEQEADIFFVQSGSAALVTGGRIVKPHTEKMGEIRGASIEGGERRELTMGDVVHIPAGVAHQLLITPGKPFTYFVVKVTGQ